MTVAYRLLLILGLASIATAMRRYLDLGTLLPEGAFWTFLGVGVVATSIGCRPWIATASVGVPRGSSRTLVAVLLGLGLFLALVAEVRVLRVVGGLAAVAAIAIPLRPRMAAYSLIPAGTLLLAYALSSIFDTMALLRVPFGFMAPPLAFALEMLGATARTSGDFIVLETIRASRALLVNPSLLGMSVAVTIAGALFAVTWFSGLRLVSPWRLGLSLILFLVLRFFLVAVVAVTADTIRDFDQVDFPTIAFLDWRVTGALDLVAALLFVGPWMRFSVERRRLVGGALAEARLRPGLACICVLTGLLLGSGAFLDCCGEKKRGRLAIDEGHSRWEPTDLQLGEDFYGEESGYNFRALTDWLSFGYGPMRRLYEPIRLRTLRDVDVLIVKTPTRHFEREEVDALRTYVANGGGLFLIGDHTNVFGTGEVLNELARPFGFQFAFDCVFDERQRFEQVYYPEEGVRRHPLVNDVEMLRFEVGCSIDIDSTRVRPVIVGRGLKTVSIDYAVSNFYPRIADYSDMRYGQVPELVTRAYGKGRVVALSDSTLLSTFSVCLPGRRELIENVVDWLNREDPGEQTRLWLEAFTILGFLTLAVALRGHGVALGVCAGTMVVATSLGLQTLGERAIHSPQESLARGEESREVHFYRGSERVFWPVTQFVRDPLTSHSMFFQWVIRTGGFPRLVDDLDRGLQGGVPLVLMDPDHGARGSIDRLVTHMESGHTVFALESEENPIVSALAEAAGMDLRRDDERLEGVTRLQSRYGEIHLGSPGAAWRRISGGRSLLRAEIVDEEGNEYPILAVKRVGEGHLVVGTCGDLFTDYSYGDRYHVIPNRDMRRLYQVQYDMFRAAY